MTGTGRRANTLRLVLKRRQRRLRPRPLHLAGTTPAGDATTTPAVAGDTVTAVVVPDAGLNVRELADPKATVAYVAPGASTIELTSETVVVNGVTWWQVYDGNWVQGQFLKFG